MFGWFLRGPPPPKQKPTQPPAPRTKHAPKPIVVWGGGGVGGFCFVNRTRFYEKGGQGISGELLFVQSLLLEGRSRGGGGPGM